MPTYSRASFAKPKNRVSPKQNRRHPFNEANGASGEEPIKRRSKDGHDCRLSSVAAGDKQSANDDNVEISRLARLGRLEYERQRKDEAKPLGMRTSILDRLVTAEREQSTDRKQGRALSLPEPEPWPDPVSGADLLDELSDNIRRHIIMSDYASDTVALWIPHTYLLDCFDISPRLAVTSPEKGCGKTTVLDLLSRLVWRPLPTANASAPAIFRVVEISKPTLLIDEADTFLLEREELRGVLNSGHRRGGSVIRTVGDEFEPRSFSTYSACAIAMIGKLPATLADRSIHIELRRRRSDEPIALFRSGCTEYLDKTGSARRFDGRGIMRRTFALQTLKCQPACSTVRQTIGARYCPLRI